MSTPVFESVRLFFFINLLNIHIIRSVYRELRFTKSLPAILLLNSVGSLTHC